MKRLEAILSRDYLESVTGLLMHHGCGEISLFRIEGAKGSELANPNPSGGSTDIPWIRLEAVVDDAEAMATMHEILDVHGHEGGEDAPGHTERVSSIALWNVKSSGSSVNHQL
jgi:hypothetical protein